MTAPSQQAVASVTAVFVTHNSAEVIEGAVRSVRAELPSAQVLVVDNASTDDTRALAEALEGTRVLETGANLGFGAAVNRGVQAATTDLVLVINPDARIVTGDLAPLTGVAPLGLVALWERDDETGHSAPLLKPDLPWAVEVLWCLAHWLLVPREVDWRRPGWFRRERLEGAAFVVDRAEFLRVGGFDERLFLYYEDNILTAAYERAGLPRRHSDVVVVHHDGSGSSPRLHERVVAWALLSQFEGVAIRHGDRTAARAVRLAVTLLGLIARVGGALVRVPVLGPRAAKKERSAREILRHLRQEAGVPPRAGAYPVAAALVTRRLGPPARQNG